MILRKLYPGDAVVLALVLLPPLVALPRLIDGASWTAASIMAVLGLAAGIVALSAFLMAGIISIRLPGLDRWFGGLVRLWHIHRLLGFSAFILIMAHAILLSLAALPISVQNSIAVLFPPVTDTAVWAGWLGLALMVAFLAPTFQFFGALHYQRWKHLHLLSIPALGLAAAHGVALGAAVPLWWLLILAAAAAFTWRKVLSRLFARHRYVVTAVNPLTKDVSEISLRAQRRGIGYEPGQFVYLTPLDPTLEAGHGEEHPYTIASSPEDRLLRIGIKSLGDATHAIQRITPGSEVTVEGPYGTLFSRWYPARPQLWLAGGIGITPFVAAARHLATQPGGEDHVALFYLANRPVRAYYLEELEQIAERQPRFVVEPHYYCDHGPLTADYLAARCPDFHEREVYVCGPPGMTAHVLDLLDKAQVPRRRIHTEAFHFL